MATTKKKVVKTKKRGQVIAKPAKKVTPHTKAIKEAEAAEKPIKKSNKAELAKKETTKKKDKKAKVVELPTKSEKPKKKKHRATGAGRPALPDNLKRQRAQIFLKPETMKFVDKLADRESRNTGLKVKTTTMIATIIENWTRRQMIKQGVY